MSLKQQQSSASHIMSQFSGSPPPLQSEKQMSNFTFTQQLQQNKGQQQKQKQLIFKLRQGLLLDACCDLKVDEPESKQVLTRRMLQKVKLEQQTKLKNEKKEEDRMLKSKLSAVLQQLPLMNRGSQSNKIGMMKRRDSSLCLLMRHSLPSDNKERQNQMDFDFVSKMQINKQMIGAKKQEQQQKNNRRQSGDRVIFDKIPSLEPIEFIPSIKGLKRKHSQNSLLFSQKSLSEVNPKSKLPKRGSMIFNNKDQQVISRNQSSSEDITHNNRQVTKEPSIFSNSRMGAHYQQSQFIDLFEDDRKMNVKISTNEKMRLIKRRDIVKSMKFIRNLGRELKQQREVFKKIIRTQARKQSQNQLRTRKQSISYSDANHNNEFRGKSQNQDDKVKMTSQQRKKQFKQRKFKTMEQNILIQNNINKQQSSNNDSKQYLVTSSNDLQKISSNVSPTNNITSNQNFTSQEEFSILQSSSLKKPKNNKQRQIKVENVEKTHQKNSSSNQMTLKNSSSYNQKGKKSQSKKKKDQQDKQQKQCKDILDQMENIDMVNPSASESESESRVTDSLSYMSQQQIESLPNETNIKEDSSKMKQSQLSDPQNRKSIKQVSKKIDIVISKTDLNPSKLNSENKMISKDTNSIQKSDQRNRNSNQVSQSNSILQNSDQQQQEDLLLKSIQQSQNQQEDDLIFERRASIEQLNLRQSKLSSNQWINSRKGQEKNSRSGQSKDNQEFGKNLNSNESSDNIRNSMNRIDLFSANKGAQKQQRISDSSQSQKIRQEQSFSRNHISDQQKQLNYNIKSMNIESNSHKIDDMTKVVLTTSTNHFEIRDFVDNIKTELSSQKPHPMSHQIKPNDQKQLVFQYESQIQGEDTEEYYVEDSSDVGSNQPSHQKEEQNEGESKIESQDQDIPKKNPAVKPINNRYDKQNVYKSKTLNIDEVQRDQLNQTESGSDDLQNDLNKIREQSSYESDEEQQRQSIIQNRKEDTKANCNLKVSKFQKLRSGVLSPNQSQQNDMNSQRSASISQQQFDDSQFENNGMQDFHSYGGQSYDPDENDYQIDSQRMLKFFQQANQQYMDRIMEEELSHISEEHESLFDETWGSITIKSRFQNKKNQMNGNSKNMSHKDSMYDGNSITHTPTRINKDQMFFDSYQDEKQGLKQQHMKSKTMVVREQKFPKKTDSATDSSNFHVSTVSKKDTLTVAHHKNMPQTPNEILEQSSQGSLEQYGNDPNILKTLTLKKPPMDPCKTSNQMQVMSSDFQVEKSDNNDIHDKMHEIVFCNLKDNSINSRSQYSINLHQQQFGDSMYIEPSQKRTDIGQSQMTDQKTLQLKSSVVKDKQDIISNSSEDDSSQLEDSYDSEVAKNNGFQQQQNLQHQGATQEAMKLMYEVTQNKGQHQVKNKMAIHRQSVNSNNKSIQNMQQQQQNTQISQSLEMAKNGGSSQAIKIMHESNNNSYSSFSGSKSSKSLNSSSESSHSLSDSVELFKWHQNQVSQALKQVDEDQQKKYALRHKRDGSLKKKKKQQKTREQKDKLLLGQVTKLVEEENDEFQSIEANSDLNNVKSNLDKLEHFDKKGELESSKRTSQQLVGKGESSSLSDDVSQLQFNPNKMKREDFDEYQLSDMEEYILTEIEQQCHAESMQKLIKDEKILQQHIQMIQKKHQESKFKRRQSRRSIQPGLDGGANLNLPTHSQIDKQSLMSCISHEQKLKLHRIKLLMMHEKRKNIFLFNVNKGDYRKLSDIDFLNEDFHGHDGPINSKNYRKHLQQFDHLQKEMKDETSSSNSKLLRVSMNSTPREVQHAITSRNESQNDEAIMQNQKNGQQISRNSQGVKKMINTSPLDEIQNLQEQKTLKQQLNSKMNSEISSSSSSILGSQNSLDQKQQNQNSKQADNKSNIVYIDDLQQPKLVESPKKNEGESKQNTIQIDTLVLDKNQILPIPNQAQVSKRSSIYQSELKESNDSDLDSQVIPGMHQQQNTNNNIAKNNTVPKEVPTRASNEQIQEAANEQQIHDFNTQPNYIQSNMQVKPNGSPNPFQTSLVSPQIQQMGFDMRPPPIDPSMSLNNSSLIIKVLQGSSEDKNQGPIQHQKSRFSIQSKYSPISTISQDKGDSQPSILKYEQQISSSTFEDGKQIPQIKISQFENKQEDKPEQLQTTVPQHSNFSLGASQLDLHNKYSSIQYIDLMGQKPPQTREQIEQNKISLAQRKISSTQIVKDNANLHNRFYSMDTTQIQNLLNKQINNQQRNSNSQKNQKQRSKPKSKKTNQNKIISNIKNNLQDLFNDLEMAGTRLEGNQAQYIPSQNSILKRGISNQQSGIATRKAQTSCFLSPKDTLSPKGQAIQNKFFDQQTTQSQYYQTQNVINYNNLMANNSSKPKSKSKNKNEAQLLIEQMSHKMDQKSSAVQSMGGFQSNQNFNYNWTMTNSEIKNLINNGTTKFKFGNGRNIFNQSLQLESMKQGPHEVVDYQQLLKPPVFSTKNQDSKQMQNNYIDFQDNQRNIFSAKNNNHSGSISFIDNRPSLLSPNKPIVGLREADASLLKLSEAGDQTHNSKHRRSSAHPQFFQNVDFKQPLEHMDRQHQLTSNHNTEKNTQKNRNRRI